jgi:hypothetical protein
MMACDTEHCRAEGGDRAPLSGAGDMSDNPWWSPKPKLEDAAILALLRKRSDDVEAHLRSLIREAMETEPHDIPDFEL